MSFTFLNSEGWSNASGNLHGGAQATLLDIVTSYAVACAARKGFWETSGVTRVLSVSYLRPAPTGTEVVIEGEVGFILLLWFFPARLFLRGICVLRREIDCC